MKENHRTHRLIHAQLRRAHFSFWILVSLATLMAGALSMSLAGAPSLLTGVSFALSAIMLALFLVFAARVMMVLATRSPRISPSTPMATNDDPVMTAKRRARIKWRRPDVAARRGSGR